MIPIRNRKKTLKVTVEEMRNFAFAYVEKYAPSKQQLKTYLLKKYLKTSVPNVKKQDVTNLIDIVLSDLEKSKFINDKFYSDSKAKSMIQRGSSINKIRNYLFGKGIKDELAVMKEIEAGSKKTVGGLYAKWAPKEGGMHDRATGISHDLMLSLLPAVGERLDRASQTYQCILAKVHEAAQVPEHYVGSARFGEVNYDRMASRCRLLWGEKVFKANDGERYDAYLAKSAVTALTDSTAKEGVKTGVILPHELVDRAFDILDSKSDTDKMKQVELNLQWRGLVKSARSALMAGEGCGVCLPMADVSGSMDGTPMSVSIALSMLLAESTPKTEPFHGKILTFSTKPKICDLKNIPDYDAEVDASSWPVRVGVCVPEAGGMRMHPLR